MSAVAGSSSAAASGSRSADPFSLYAKLSHAIDFLTVAQLKAVLKDLSSSSAADSRIKISGNKPQLLDRMREFFESAYETRNLEKWTEFRRIMTLHWGQAALPDWALGGSLAAPPRKSFGGVPANKLGGSAAASGSGAGPSAAAHAGHAALARNASAPVQRPRFRPSPFYSVAEWASPNIQLSECFGNERRAGTIRFQTSASQRALLAADPTHHCYRLFIAPKPAWDASAISHGSPCLIDFPASSELLINNMRHPATFKGNKKHPGRVPPPDLNARKSLSTREGAWNTVTLNYASDKNSGTFVGKYVMAIALCKNASPEELVETLKSTMTKTKEAVVLGMRSAAEDDDIEAGAQTFRFLCPLSYVPISTPVRSSICPHAQCFDALAFYSMNSVTPTWECPVCSQNFKPENLFVDGYAQDILRRVPAAKERVLVEPDGVWHTEDDRYKSTNEEAARLAAAAESGAAGNANGSHASSRNASTEQADAGGSGDADGAGPSRASKAAAPVLVLEDTPSPGGSAPQAPSATSAVRVESAAPPRAAVVARPPAAAPPPRASVPAGPAVIDLTLDSSDEDDEPLPPPPPRPAARRESTQRGASSTSAARFGSAAAAVQDAFGSPGAGYVNGNSAASAVARRESAAAAEVGHLSEESEGPRRPYKRPRLQLRDLDYDDEFPDDGDHSDDAPLAAHHQRNGTGSGSHGAARASDAHGSASRGGTSANQASYRRASITDEDEYWAAVRPSR